TSGRGFGMWTARTSMERSFGARLTLRWPATRQCAGSQTIEIADENEEALSRLFARRACAYAAWSAQAVRGRHLHLLALPLRGGAQPSAHARPGLLPEMRPLRL